MPSSPFVLLLLAPLLAACARAPESNPDPVPAPPSAATENASSTSDSTTADPAPPVLTTMRSRDGGLATLTFRTAEGVPLGDAPLVLTVEDETFEMPLQAGPARFTDPDGTVVDQASYTLSRAMLYTLAGAPHEEVTVSVALSGDYVAFPYVSGDLIE
jgi:hypothetical protein